MAKAAKSKNPPIEAKLNAILALLALWMGAWLISVWAFFLRTAPEVGLSNLQMALGWQGVAGLLAFAIAGIGFGLPEGHGVRRMSTVPLGMTIAVGLLSLTGLF